MKRGVRSKDFERELEKAQKDPAFRKEINAFLNELTAIENL